MHLTRAKEAEVTALLARSALTVLHSEALEVFSTLNLALEVADVGDRLVLSASNLNTLSAVDGVARSLMLLKNMEAADLTFGHLENGS